VGTVSTVALLVAAAMLAWAALIVAMVAGVWWLRRRVRRRMEALRLVLTGRVRGATAPAGASGSRWLWSLPVPDRRWRGGVRTRRELWRAVGAAEHALAAAKRGGAPTGDFDSLCRRLRRAAERADCSLAMWQRSEASGAGLEPVAAEVSDVVSAARQIQAAASAALASVSRPAAKELADDVRIEVVALTAGIARAAGTTGV